MTVLAAQDAYGLSAPAQGMAEVLAKLPEATVTVLDGGGVFTADAAAEYQYISGNFEGPVNALFNEMVRRNNTHKTAAQSHEPLPEYPLWIYQITGFSNILAQICDTAKGIGTMTTDPWYRKFVSGSDGIWAGDGVSDQYVLKIGKISSDLYAELEPGFGYAIRHGRPTLMKLLTCRHGEEIAE